jgi:hypothetical protein
MALESQIKAHNHQHMQLQENDSVTNRKERENMQNEMK